MSLITMLHPISEDILQHILDETSTNQIDWYSVTNLSEKIFESCLLK